MPSFLELIDQQDPEALRLQQALAAHIAAAKASDRVEAASLALDEASHADAQARSIRDGHLAELQRRLDQLAEDDEIGRAQMALERAKVNAAYRPAAHALCKAEDNLADAKRALRSAVEDAAKYPIPTVEP